MIPGGQPGRWIEPNRFHRLPDQGKRFFISSGMAGNDPINQKLRHRPEREVMDGFENRIRIFDESAGVNVNCKPRFCAVMNQLLLNFKKGKRDETTRKVCTDHWSETL
jgi:hypothetical protein